MLSDLLTQSITIICRSESGIIDAYGSDIPTEQVLLVLGAIQGLTETERNQIPGATDRMYTLPTITIDAAAVVIADGIRYEVTGPPNVVRNARTNAPHHVETLVTYSGLDDVGS